MRSYSLINLTCAVLLAVLLGSIFVVAKSIVVPLFFAAIVAYVIAHTAERLSRFPGLRWCPIWSLRVMALAIFAIILVLFFGVVISTTQELLARLPQYQSNIELLVQKTMATVGGAGTVDLGQMFEAIFGQIDIRSLALTALSSVTSGGGTIALILIYALFMLSERGRFVGKIFAAASTESQAEKVLSIVKEINGQIASYLAAKTGINVILGALSFAILMLLGIDFALFWAILIALLNYIPYVGSMLGVALPVALSIAQFGSLQISLVALALLMAAQLWVGNFLEPRMLGRQLNMSPLVILLSLSVFSGLWGLAGAILAVPLTSIIAIVLATFKETRFISVLIADSNNSAAWG